MLLDLFINSRKNPLPGGLSINDLSWSDFIDKVRHYAQILKLASPQRLLLKIPNTSSGVALLLASAVVNCETIILPDYQTDEMAQTLIKEYQISHYFSLLGDELQCKESQSINQSPLDQPYLCLLTSGTTGVPKCVKHSWTTLISRIKIDSRYKDNSWFLGYPVTHFAGLQVVLQSLSNFGSLVIPEVYEPAHCIALMAQYKPTYLNCTPTFMRQMLLSASGFDWSCCGIKRITFGGEVVDQTIIDLVKKSIPNVGITHIYASTELGSLITVNDEKEGFPVSLIDAVNLKVVEDELFVKPSKSAMLRYLNSEQLIKDQWVATNDLIEIKGDRALFRGRKDDLINIGGYKVRPAIVEQVIRGIAGVQEVVVIGQKNPIMGSILTAKVQADPAHDEKTLKKSIITTCKQHLPGYMVPRMVSFVDALAMTNTRKLIRRHE